MEVRGHLGGVSLSFHRMGDLELKLQLAVSPGEKHLYLLNYLSSPCVSFLHDKESFPLLPSSQNWLKMQSTCHSN